MAKNTKALRIMDSDKLASLVNQMAAAAKGTPYTGKTGRAVVNDGTRVNCVYPRGQALNDILLAQGFDPIESVQAAKKAGKLVVMGAGGHSVSVATVEMQKAAKSQPLSVEPIGVKNAEVAAKFFAKAEKPKAVKPVRETTMPWGKDTPPVEQAKGGIVTETGVQAS